MQIASRNFNQNYNLNCKKNNTQAFKGFLKIPTSLVEDSSQSQTIKRTLDWACPVRNTPEHAAQTGNLLKVVDENKHDVVSRMLDKMIGKGNYILEKMDMGKSLNRFYKELNHSQK